MIHLLDKKDQILTQQTIVEEEGMKKEEDPQRKDVYSIHTIIQLITEEVKGIIILTTHTIKKKIYIQKPQKKK